MKTSKKTLPHCYGSRLAAVGVATTGSDPNSHEILGICIWPLVDFEPVERGGFEISIRPEKRNWCKRTAQLSLRPFEGYLKWGDSKEYAIQKIDEWFGDSKPIMPLAWNWPKCYAFLTALLSYKRMKKMFRPQHRDPLSLASARNDESYLGGRRTRYPKFSQRSLRSAANINMIGPDLRSAMEDALDAAKVYKHLLSPNLC